MIDWLIQQASEHPQVAAGLPPEGLLSTQEMSVYGHLHSAKRRRDWLLGRWTAKRLVQAAIEGSNKRRLSWRDISILAAGDGAPEVWLGEDNHFSRGDLNVSISHSHNVSLCAVVTPNTHLLGADIEAIEPRTARFVNGYFTDSEIESVQQTPSFDRDCLITTIWSGKEAALKAVRQGLRVDTRMVSCNFQTPFVSSQKWQPFAITWCSPQMAAAYPQLNGWCRVWHGFVLTIAAAGDRAGSRVTKGH